MKIDFASYLPSYGATSLGFSGDSQAYTRHTFIKDATWLQGLYLSLFNQNKAGTVAAWIKESFTNSAWRVDTYGVLFLGSDGSVTEVGDWLMGSNPNRAFGYHKYGSSTPSGLLWAGVGGLTQAQDGSDFIEVDVVDQSMNGQPYTKKGAKAYSKAAAIEVLPTMVLNGVTYTDVLHVGMYHGTRVPNIARVMQNPRDMPFLADGMYHLSVDDWDTYAMELWIAKGVGIIKEVVPYIEDASWWSLPNNIGDIYKTNGFQAKEIIT